MKRPNRLNHWFALLLPTLSLATACGGHEASDKKIAGVAPKSNRVEERFRLFVPSHLDGGGAKIPLLVMLHGCDQDAEEFESGSRMNDYAQRFGFAVLYPEQLKGRNLAGCWRWFDPQNRKPKSGELGEIKSMIEQTIREYPIDSERIQVAGLSAGAATAAALLACYPDDFEGAALLSGPSLNSADNELMAAAVMRMGPKSWLDLWATKSCKPARSQKRLLVIYGDRDSTVNPTHSLRLMDQFAKPKNDLDSFKMELSERGKKPVKVWGTVSPKAESFLVSVAGMKHAWAGGRAGSKYFDSDAFMASELIARFLVLGERTFVPTAETEILHSRATR